MRRCGVGRLSHMLSSGSALRLGGISVPWPTLNLCSREPCCPAVALGLTLLFLRVLLL